MCCIAFGFLTASAHKSQENVTILQFRLATGASNPYSRTHEQIHGDILKSRLENAGVSRTLARVPVGAAAGGGKRRVAALFSVRCWYYFFGVGLNRLFVVVVRGRWVLMPV
jgi:hypothetical protein